MRRLITCIAIICIISVIATFALFSTRVHAEKIADNLTQIEMLVKSGDKEQALRLADETLAEWDEFISMAHIYIEQNQLTLITASLGKIHGLVETDYSALSAECESLVVLVRDLYESQLPLFNNVL